MKQFALAIVLLFATSTVQARDIIAISLTPDGKDTQVFEVDLPTGAITLLLNAFANKGWSEGMVDENDLEITKARWFALEIQRICFGEAQSFRSREKQKASENEVKAEIEALKSAAKITRKTIPKSE